VQIFSLFYSGKGKEKRGRSLNVSNLLFRDKRGKVQGKYERRGESLKANVLFNRE